MYERTHTPPGHDASTSQGTSPNPTLHAECQAGRHRVPLFNSLWSGSPGCQADTLPQGHSSGVKNVTWAPHFCVLVLFWVPNILQCRESKLWGSTLTSKKEKKEHLGWKRWWFKLCLLFCISQSRIFIQCPILFWILLYPKNCPNRDAWDWVPSKNLWCSFENQAIIVMCTPVYRHTALYEWIIGIQLFMPWLFTYVNRHTCLVWQQ